MVESPKNKLLFLFAAVAIATVLVDQVTKGIIFSIKPSLQFGILSIRYLTNTGAGFGILQERVALLTIISIIVAIITIIYYPKIPKLILPQLFMALFLGGVIGNLLDRLFRKLVIDFITVSFWPAFNIADAAITIGVAGIVWLSWKKTTANQINW